MNADGGRERSPRSGAALAVLGVLALAAFVGLMALGIWQVERLSWKLDLIAQIESRIHAAPVAAPAPGVDVSRQAYLRVKARGSFLNDRETLVQAVTDLGGGFWVLTPLRTDQGFIVLVNRGFVPSDRRDAGSRAGGMIAGDTEVTGLLRLTEPGGGFLRSNDPAGNRWYSRDIAAIAQARALDGVAPYFIDADAVRGAADAPVGGLTVVNLPNNHLAYALTWFALALMVAAAAAYVARDEWRMRRETGRGD